MVQTILIDGCAAITSDKDGRMIFEFLPNDPQAQLLDSCRTGGSGQLMRSGSFYFNPSKKRIRSNNMLIRKAAHGRLSHTRDGAYQLTLKSFAVEDIDWQRAFLEETVQILTEMMGPERMTCCLKELITNINNKNK